MDRNAGYGRFVDVLRGIAILGVMTHHFYYPTVKHISADWPAPLNTLAATLNNGHLGVSLFFILSGLVLYRPSFAATWQSTVKYYAARAWRLWPLYMLVIFLTTIVLQHDPLLFIKSVPLMMSGLHDLIPAKWSGVNVLWVLWSLGVEILFSILLPLIILVQARAGFWRVAISIVVFSLLYRCVAEYVWPTVAHISPLKDNIFGRIDDFVIGMMAARAIADGWRPPRIALPAAFAALLCVGYGWSAIYGIPRTIPVAIITSVLHLMFSSAIFFIITSCRDSRIWGYPAWEPLIFAGTVCYSAYLIHAILLQYVFGNSHGVFEYASFVVLTFGISAVLFFYVESLGIKKLPTWAIWVANRPPFARALKAD